MSKTIVEVTEITDEKLFNRIVTAVDFILEYGEIDGAHHKQWVLTQVLRTLVDDDEGAWENLLSEYEDLHGTAWDEGIAP